MALLAGFIKLADRATNSWSTRLGANHFLKRYGHMTHLKINRDQKSADFELLLLGETAPIQISIASYAYEKLPDSTGRITLTGVKVSRPWMQELAKQVAEGKPLPVPAEFAGFLAMIL
jgi:hypothetical protein